MRLLLDESVPVRLKLYLPSHTVSTVVEMGWVGVTNGNLLVLAASKFDALITIDKNLQYQQNLAELPLSIFVLDALSNTLHSLLPLIPDLEHELNRAPSRALVVISS